MNFAPWFVLLLALAGANLPFVTDRLLGAWRLAAPKPFALRLAELVACYLLVGALAWLLERRAGQAAPQGWQFYAITGALFVTLAFPGFVWCCLVRRGRP